MKSRKTIAGKSFQKAHLKVARDGLKAKEPKHESYFGLPPGAKFPPAFPGKEEIWPNALPADFGERNNYRFPITGKK